MPNGKKILQPWQVFHAANKHFTPGAIAKIFGKANIRTAYLYGQDPAYTEKRCKNPLEAMHMMFSRLDEIGRGDVARAGIAYLQTAIEPNEHEAVADLQPTLQEEILADYSAVAALQRGIEECEDVDLVDTLKQRAIDEIERTYAKYLQDCGK